MNVKAMMCLLAGMSLISGFYAEAQQKERKDIEDKYKWNLTDLYPSDEAWKAEKEKIAQRIPAIAQYKGTLHRSVRQLFSCLEEMAYISKELQRLRSYASMSADQDTRESRYQAMTQEIAQIRTNFSAAISFIEPEILRMDQKLLQRFLKQEPRLQPYAFYLNDIQRRKAHTGTEGEEKIIADAGLMADAAGRIYNIFSNADFPYAQVTLSDGKTIRLDQAGFTLARTSVNRADRKLVFETYFNKLNEFRRTFGMQLYSEIKTHLFYKNARKYSSCLEAALDANNIPVEVYHQHLKNVNDHLPSFHRYLKLRQRMMGVDQLHYYDLYAPLVGSVQLRYEVEDAKKLILASLRPLGEEYVTVVRKAFEERWIDMFPSPGKRSGAYSNGSAYDVHPYILMNYQGLYSDLTTLTHELGHTMHSYFSNKKQPYITSDYPIFVAEVASTFNEALLIDYLLKQIKDDQVRLALLGNLLENIKGTVFRQTQFAEFELKIHELAEKGEALTGDRFNEIYLEITRKYYGHDQKVCIVDDEIKAEWMFIPHFYYDFYVYQYATSYTASAALSEKVLAGDQAATTRYMDFLSAGGSDYPINLLKKAGVDMLSAEPMKLTMEKMNRVMDEIEKILDRSPKKNMMEER